MAIKSPDSFYVVLTNISKTSQAVFEDRNSWGYQSVSFDLQTQDGRKFIVTKKTHEFTRNVPSTFTIQPGEHMVYPITLNDEWTSSSGLPMADETPIPITLRAIYEVNSTLEASREKVWTGHLESNEYHFSFRHW